MIKEKTETKENKRGKLIVVEANADRLGKSTLTKKLIRCLQFKGIPVYTHHYPDSNSKIGEMIYHLLGPDFPIDAKEIDAITLGSIYLLDMVSSKALIQQKLDEGYYVILDRYFYSTLLYETTVAAQQFNIDVTDEKGCATQELLSVARQLKDLATGVVNDLPEPDYVFCIHARHVIESFYNSVEEQADDLEILDFQNKLIEVFYALKDHSNLLHNFVYYDRLTETGEIVESDDIVKDILKQLGL